VIDFVALLDPVVGLRRPVNDADGLDDHVVSGDLASFAARGLLDRRRAYNVAY
jgi:hypothetical protein